MQDSLRLEQAEMRFSQFSILSIAIKDNQDILTFLLENHSQSFHPVLLWEETAKHLWYLVVLWWYQTVKLCVCTNFTVKHVFTMPNTTRRCFLLLLCNNASPIAEIWACEGMLIILDCKLKLDWLEKAASQLDEVKCFPRLPLASHFMTHI